MAIKAATITLVIVAALALLWRPQPLARTAAGLAPDLRSRFEAFLGAGEERFAAVYLPLQTPGLKPHVGAVEQWTTPVVELVRLRDNWWCSFGETGKFSKQAFELLYRLYPLQPLGREDEVLVQVRPEPRCLPGRGGFR